MQCAPGFHHHFCGRNSFGFSRFDFRHPPSDFFRPGGFNFRVGIIVNRFDDSFGETSARFWRQLQYFFFQCSNRHGSNKAEKPELANE